MPKRLRSLLPDLAFVAGVGLGAYGLLLIYVPAAFLFASVMCCGVGWLSERGS
jgi:hypothetical protein